MKILTINTFDIRGGAAVAALRLLKGLEKYHGVQNHLLVGLKESSASNVTWTRQNNQQYYFEHGLDFLTRSVGLQYQFFPFSSRTIIRKAREIQPDIIYFRNLHGSYFAVPLMARLSKIAPIVWTLSDMWSFTGNCAHSFDDCSWKMMRGCRNFRVYPSIGINTGRWLLRRKRRVYARSDLHVVCPSRWLQGLARQSPVFDNIEINQIYNGFDLEVFRPGDRTCIRRIFAIPDGSPVMMFCADILAGNPWKGGQDLLDFMARVNKAARGTIHLLIVGKGSVSEPEQFENLVVLHTGTLQNDFLMAACYSAADLFIYPTRADNLPNVLIEAVACGTPCVTCDVGGCGEIVKNGETGFVVEAGDIAGLAAKSLALLEDTGTLEKMSVAARADALERFSLERMCSEYYAYFSRVAEGRRRSDGC